MIQFSPSTDDQQPSSTSWILLGVQFPEIVMRLVDTLVVEAGQIVLEGVFELLGEGLFLRKLGGTGV